MSAIKPLQALLFSLLLAAGSAVYAQQFAGQVVTMIVNYGAGGPTDIEARIVAKHLPKYLQGVSTVIVRNVGGGGGNIGVNQLGEAAERDRLNISFFTWDPIDQFLQNPALKVRYNDLKFIAGFKMTTLLYVRRDTPPGISKPTDVAKAPLFKAGTLAPSSHATVRMRLALDLLGAKYETIAGYKGLADVIMAVRRNDVQLSNISLPSWSVSVKPQLVDTGMAVPVLQYGTLRPEGAAGRSIDLPNVPTFLEVYKEVWGKDAMSSGEKWDALQLLTRILDSSAFDAGPGQHVSHGVHAADCTGRGGGGNAQRDGETGEGPGVCRRLREGSERQTAFCLGSRRRAHHRRSGQCFADVREFPAQVRCGDEVARVGIIDADFAVHQSHRCAVQSQAIALHNDETYLKAKSPPRSSTLPDK
ncbi:MAG: hypothetical protein HYU75_13315 [Betaproteobacteria bacterium]|nr:hypothetical protein [Betaproteobacteria bacterium]